MHSSFQRGEYGAGTAVLEKPIPISAKILMCPKNK